MQVVAFNTRPVLRQAVRTKIKRRVKEAIRLIVMHGAAVDESPGGPKLMFRAEDVGADKPITPGALQPTVLGQNVHAFARRLDVYGAADHGDVPHAVCGATWCYA